MLLDSAPPDRFERTVQAFENRDSGELLVLLRESDGMQRALDFARERVDAGIAAIDGLDLGGTELLLRDLASSVVDRNR